MKIKTGEMMLDFSFDTSNGQEMKLSDVYGKKKHTLLLFLRYYGCTLCQLDLREYREAYDEFRKKDTEVVIVLQSTPDVINESKADIPYIIACDPEQTLYRRFEIKPAKNMMGLMSLEVVPKMKRAEAAGITHGKYA